MPQALDQQDISACAVNACAIAASYSLNRQGHANFCASRLFLYYNVRRYVLCQTRLSNDTGCTLGDVCKAITTYGVCDEAVWPYTKRLLGCEPPAHVYVAARGMPRLTCLRVKQSMHDIVSCLLNHHPVLMGMSVYSNIMGAAKTGVMSMPAASDKHLGDHAVVVCGYDLDSNTFKVLNCWGDTWGDHGFFRVPTEFVLNPQHCWDLWILVLQDK